MAEVIALSREARNRMREIFSREITCEKCEKFDKSKSLENLEIKHFCVEFFLNDFDQNFRISFTVSICGEITFYIVEKLIPLSRTESSDKRSNDYSFR